MADDNVIRGAWGSYKYIGYVDADVTREDNEGWSYEDTERTSLYLSLDNGVVVGDIALYEATLEIERG